MNTNEFKYIYNYVMNDKELAEAECIRDTVNKLVSCKIEIGNPDTTTDYTQGYKAGTIKVLTNDSRYVYCFLTVDERGCFDCIIVNEWINPDSLSKDAIIHFLLWKIDKDVYRECHLHEGYLVHAKKSNNGKICLEQIIDYGSRTLNGEVQHALGHGEAIYRKHTCSCKGVIFYVEGETAGMDCPYCKKHIKFGL